VGRKPPSCIAATLLSAGWVACGGELPPTPGVDGGTGTYLDSASDDAPGSDDAGDTPDASGADDGSSSGAATGGVTCSSPTDCRTYSNPCVGCTCMPIRATAVVPACSPLSLGYGPTACGADPCAGHTVICVVGTCTLF
jgi:hypothetical protein